MRHSRWIILLLSLIYGCQGETTIDGRFAADLTDNTALCAGQTTPSPQCPGSGTPMPTSTPTTLPDNNEPDNDGDTNCDNPKKYRYDNYGYIQVCSPYVKNSRDTLEVVFTAAKDINKDCQYPVSFGLYYNTNTDFNFHDVKITTKPASGFASVSGSSVRICGGMKNGEKFTAHYTLTPTTSGEFFDFKLGRAPSYFKYQSSFPRITVYAGDKPPVTTPYTYTPVYKYGSADKLRLTIAPFPHSLPSNGGELTLTFTANMELRKKSVSPTLGQKTHKYKLTLVPTPHVDENLSELSWKGGKPRYVTGRVCTSNECSINILEMNKGDAFTMKLRVEAKNSFKIKGFKKIADDMHTELNNKPPLIKVK